jgi:simple sugar transport system permease protein
VNEVATPAATPARPRFSAWTAAWASQIGITTAFVLLWLTFIVLAPGTFLSENIYLSFAQTTPFFALVAMPLTMVIIAGDIDLSFPSVMALGMVGFVFVWQATGSVALGAAASLGVGALAGLFNGLIITFVGILARRDDRHPVPLPGPDARPRQRPELRPRRHQKSPAYDVLVGRPLGIPMEFWWLVMATVATWVLLNRHRLGQNAYVVGDNRHAATLMGIPIRRTRIMLFVLTGLMAAFAGLLNSLQIVNFYPGMGDGYLLPTLAAVFVGGTSVFGGRGSVWGTFIGAFMIGGITAVIIASGLTDYYTNLVYGAVILISVSIRRAAAAFMR